MTAYVGLHLNSSRTNSPNEGTRAAIRYASEVDRITQTLMCDCDHESSHSNPKMNFGEHVILPPWTASSKARSKHETCAGLAVRGPTRMEVRAGGSGAADSVAALLLRWIADESRRRVGCQLPGHSADPAPWVDLPVRRRATEHHQYRGHPQQQETWRRLRCQFR